MNTNKQRKPRSKNPPTANIRDCEFVALKWDQNAVNVLGELVASIRDVAAIFKGAGVHVDSMIKLQGGSSATLLGKVNARNNPKK